MPWERVIPVGMCDAVYVLQRSGSNRADSITMSHDPDGALDVGLANSLFTSFQTHMIPALASAYTFQSVHILGQQDSENQVAFDSTLPPVVGTRAASGVTALGSPTVAALVRKNTAYAGKAMRGRFFFPGLAETDYDAHGKIDGAKVTLFESAVDAWHANIVTFAKPMLSHSCFHEEDQPPCTPKPWTPIISLSVDDVIASQRRRLAR